MGFEEEDGALKRGKTRVSQSLPDELSGDVHAIENVTYIVQHAGGDFGHAGKARGLDEGFSLSSSFGDLVIECFVGLAQTAIGDLKFVEHGIEGLGELTDFIIACPGRTNLIVADFGNTGGAIGEVFQTLQQQPRQEPCKGGDGKKREREQNEQGGQEI